MYGTRSGDPVDGHGERLEVDQVARDAQQGRPFRERLADEAEPELLEVAQAAVDELGRPAAACLRARSSRSTSAARRPRDVASSSAADTRDVRRPR